jgi:hypothetical protein
MAIFGRTEFLPPKQRDSLYELAGVRGFDGEFEKSIYIKGVETRDLAPGSPAAAFLESARLQQQIAKMRPAHWAMVHATGFAEKGAFVVVDHYPQTAADVAKLGLRSDRALHRIIMSVLKGLRDLQQLTGRPHGNLKPSNVLISGGDLETAEVALCDPAPPNLLAVGQAKDDLFQLGKLIHKLVLGQSFTGAWPVAPTGAWTDLGRSGRRWRNLCNRLLNPNPEKRFKRLATVYNKVARLRPRRAGLLRPIALVVVLLGIGGLTFTQWDRIKGWTQAHLPRSEVATTQPAQPARENPQHLAVVPTTVDPPTRPTTQNTATLAADATFLGEYQSLYEQRGWSAPAQYLSSLRARLSATPATDTAARKAMSDTGATLKTIEERWASLQETSNFLHQRSHNDPVLLTYPQFVRQSISPVISQAATASPLPALLEKLEAAAADKNWGAVVTYLRSADAQKLDHPWLIESSPLHKQFANKSVASSEDLQAWLTHAKSPQFARLAEGDDPRSRWSPRQQISRLRANDLQKLASLYKDPAEAKSATAAFEAKLAEIETSAAKLIDGNLPWSMKNRPQITESIAQIDQQLATAAEQIRAAAAKQQDALDQKAAREAIAMRQRQDAQQFAARLEGLKLSPNPAIQREWQAQSKPFLNDVRADATKYRPELAERAARVQQRLEMVDAAYRALPEKLEVNLGASPPAWTQRLIAGLQSIDAKYRERFLEDVLTIARGGGDREPTAEEVKTRAAEQRKVYDAWATAAAKLVVDLSEVDRLLSSGYSLDERPQRERPSARQLLEHWQRHEFFSSELVQSAIEPLMTPIRVLEQGEEQGLLQLAGADQQRTGLRLSAWRNLAGADVSWPAAQDDLKRAITVSDSLAAAITKGSPDEARRDLQLTELGRATAKIWKRFVTRAKAPEDINFAFAVREKLAIPADLIDDRTRFNIALYDSRRLFAQATDDKARTEATKLIAAKLQTAIEALPKAQREAPDIAAFETALRQSKNATVRADFSMLGPMSATARGASPIKWKFRHDDQHGTVTYTAAVSPEITPDELEIVFKRVATETGDVYLSTTEISVGFFADVITASNKWGDVGRMLWSYDPRDDPRPGPRSWEWPRYGRRTEGIRRTNYWLTGSSDHYPESLATIDNRMVLRDESGRQARDLNPSKRQPMQYVSPDAAIYFSKLLECRLPTPAEWKAAYRLHARDNWNLRDRTFKTLQRWLSRPSNADRYMPDLGIFMIATDKPTPEIWMESRLFNKPAGGVDREYDDKVLWFREVTPASQQNFANLVGNVAEMTYDNGKLYAIGGSALSPPSRPIDQEIEIPNWRTGNKGYSDVGFRLAFPAPPNPTQQLLALLEKQSYLSSQ